ncbi:MAG TPA: 5-formyltetrahydrofolate cyclo-ligase [Actinopolymorphaceae bacterium]
MRGARGAPEQVREKKDQLRRRVTSRRRRLRVEELRSAANALRDVLLEVPEVGRAAVVAAYVAVGTEPGTGPLLDALVRRGIHILLPVMLPDGDLDWASYDADTRLVPATYGLMQPDGPTLGPAAIGAADAVLVPGLAVDRTGLRLGRGGGSYDRALPRLAPEAFSCALLHDGEVLDQPVPHDDHDQRVRAAATPSGLIRFDVRSVERAARVCPMT